MMSIHYRIEENNFKPGSFYARVIQGETVTLDDLLPNIVTKTALSATDVKSVFSAVTAELATALAAGHKVTLADLVNFTISLSGNLESADATINPETAQLNVVVHPAKSLLETVTALASYTREISGIKSPHISNFLDIASNDYDKYTAGSIVRLKGENLKFNLAAADEGVFLHNGSTETRLALYSVAGKKQIDALIPLGVSGSMTVTVRARYTTTGSLREGSYQHQVTDLKG